MVKLHPPDANAHDQVGSELIGRDLTDLRGPTSAEDRLADLLRNVTAIADRARRRIEIGDARDVCSRESGARNECQHTGYKTNTTAQSTPAPLPVRRTRCS